MFVVLCQFLCAWILKSRTSLIYVIVLSPSQLPSLSFSSSLLSLSFFLYPFPHVSVLKFCCIVVFDLKNQTYSGVVEAWGPIISQMGDK